MEVALTIIESLTLFLVINFVLFLFTINQPHNYNFLEDLGAKEFNMEVLNNILNTDSNTCEYFLKRTDLLFTLPRDEISTAFERIDSWRNCFSNEEFLFKVIDLTIKHDREDLMTPFLLTKVAKGSLGTVLFKCASNRFYSCVAQILQVDPMTFHDGQNILHLASVLKDTLLVEISPSSIPYLHLRNTKDRNVPTKYVRNKYLVEAFAKRAKVESRTSPYPKEIHTHIEYMKKTLELNILTNRHRIKYLFDDNSWLQVNSELKLTIPRDKILEYSFNALHNNGAYYWYSPSYYSRSFIKFIGEHGIDQSGVTNDWISSLIHCFFATGMNEDGELVMPLFELFSDDSNYYIPTGVYSEAYYKFAGSIIALALKHGISIRVEFIPAVYLLILEIEPVRFEDLELVQPQIAKHLMELRDSFLRGEQVVGFNFKNIVEVDAYIKDYATSLLYTRHRKSIKAFSEGFRSKIPRTISKYLDLADLREILRGHVTISVEELKKNIHFSKTTYSETLFFRVLDEFTDEDRFKFFRFVTGRYGLPFGGLSELEHRITVSFDAHPAGYLPTSNTCYSILNLPNFSSKNELKKSLLMAIYNCDTLDNA